MLLLLPSRKLPMSMQLRLSGLGLLAWALVSFVPIASRSIQSNSAIVDALRMLVVVTLCAASVLGALFLSSIYWRRLEALLATARPGHSSRLRAHRDHWDWAHKSIFLVLGVGMVTAFAQHAAVDLTIAALALTHAGTATLCTGLRLRTRECQKNVLYYCLAGSRRSWWFVSIKTSD